MSHYKPNLRDLEFALFELLGRGEIMGTGPYEDVDTDTAREMLAQVAVLATEKLAPSLISSDRTPPTFDPATHSAALPAAFAACYRAYVDAEFWRTDVPVELGGTAIPPSLRWAMAELVLGANPAVHMYSSGFSFAKLLWTIGTDAQRQLARHMVDRHWGSTMVLTEPEAGSDVGAGRAKAVQQPDGTWHLERGQALHHLGRGRHLREHRAPGAGPPRGRRPGHQGAVAVRRAEVPRRPRDRRARRAQRRLRHQRRAQDGPEGLGHVRAAVRRGRRHPRRRNTCWATCTTASRRCSTSSSTPA